MINYQTYQEYVAENAGWIQKEFQKNTANAYSLEYFLLKNYICYLQQISHDPEEVSFLLAYIKELPNNNVSGEHRRSDDLMKGLRKNIVSNINWFQQRWMIR